MYVGRNSMCDTSITWHDAYHTMASTIQMRTWLAATCGRMLVALQLPRDDCCLMGCRTLEDLENVSEAQVDEKIIPAIADLGVPLVTSSRLKRLSKAIREGAGSHGTEIKREQ